MTKHLKITEEFLILLLEYISTFEHSLNFDSKIPIHGLMETFLEQNLVEVIIF